MQRYVFEAAVLEHSIPSHLEKEIFFGSRTSWVVNSLVVAAIAKLFKQLGPDSGRLRQNSEG